MVDYEYHGLMASCWDLLRGDTSRWQDRFFYLDLIRKFGQPVLDVGCGTGRLLLDYVQHGMDVHGVDNSPEMLVLCREKAKNMGLSVVLYQQVMQLVSIPRRYRTILVPSSSLQLVIDPNEAVQAVNKFLNLLYPGGALVASFMTLWSKGQPLESEQVQSATRPEDGATIRRRSRAWYDPERELESTEDIYQIIKEEKVIYEEIHQRCPATRSYTLLQAKQLFEQAGFKSVETYHQFSHSPANLDDRLFTVVGVRPE